MVQVQATVRGSTCSPGHIDRVQLTTRPPTLPSSRMSSTLVRLKNSTPASQAAADADLLLYEDTFDASLTEERSAGKPRGTSADDSPADGHFVWHHLVPFYGTGMWQGHWCAQRRDRNAV